MGTNISKGVIDQEINEQMKAQEEKLSSHALSITDYKSKCQKPQQAVQEMVGYADFESRPILDCNLDQETVLKKIIPGQDGRIRVNMPRQWPHSVHGLLSMKFGDKLYTGTATMIGPNIAITAAHNLYKFHAKMEVKVSDVHFHPAANDHLLPFGVVEVVAFYYPEEYKTTGKEEDYALLILQKDVGDQTGYFGLHAIESQELEGKKINITGYPADKVAENPKHHQMWGMEGPICHLDDNLISYQIDTFGGQSGSGIWYDAGDEYYIVGVHVHYSGAYNQGTFLNKKRLGKIREWIRSFYMKPEYAKLLQSINLHLKNIGNTGAEYLSKSDFPQLQSLDLYSSVIGDKGAWYLSKASFSQLQSLLLSKNDIGEKGAEYLSKAKFPQLQSLNLSGNRIGHKGVEHLSEANFSQLQSLELIDNKIGKKGAEYLSKADFKQLRSLNLSNNLIGKKGAGYLGKSNFPKLQSLNLENNKIQDKGAESLSKANFLELRLLNLSMNQIGSKGAEYLSKANFPQLQSLDLSRNLIGAKGAESLSKANFLQLRSLNLSCDSLGDKGIESLSKSNFKQLRSLTLSNNQIGDKGAECMSKANLPQLHSLYFFKNQIGNKGVEFLQVMKFDHSESSRLNIYY